MARGNIFSTWPSVSNCLSTGMSAEAFSDRFAVDMVVLVYVRVFFWIILSATGTCHRYSASEVTTLWRYTNLFIIIIIIFLTPVLNSRGKKKLRYAI